MPPDPIIPTPVVLGLGAAAVAALCLTLVYPQGPGAGTSADAPPLDLPVRTIDPSLLGSVRAARDARLTGFAPGAEETGFSAALDVFFTHEATLARVPISASVSRADVLAADEELQKLSRAAREAGVAHVRTHGTARYAAYASWLTNRFLAALPGALAAPADTTSDAVVGAFPALFVERGLFQTGVAPGAEALERAASLYIWRIAAIPGPNGPAEVLDATERLLYHRTVLEVEAPGDPTARLERRLATLPEIAALDPTYPVLLTRGILLLRAGDLAGARVAFADSAATAAPGDDRARDWIAEIDGALATPLTPPLPPTPTPTPAPAPATSTATAAAPATMAPAPVAP